MGVLRPELEEPGGAPRGRSWPWRKLRRVHHPWHWVAAGVPVQVIGVALPAAYLVSQAHREGVGGHLTAATVELVWRHQGHTGTGVALVVVGALVFAAGSILVARPYVRRPVLLLAAVPLAGVAGMLLLGAFALLLAFIFDFGEFPFEAGSRRSRQRRRRPDSS